MGLAFQFEVLEDREGEVTMSWSIREEYSWAWLVLSTSLMEYNLYIIKRSFVHDERRVPLVLPGVQQVGIVGLAVGLVIPGVGIL